MSKRDNKRFNDADRKSAPKRGGKNRRDYGDNYEPKSRTAGAGKPAGARRASGAAKAATGRTRGSSPRKALGFDLDREYEAQKPQVGTDGLEVIAGRNPVVEVLSGERDVERVFIADGSEGSVSKIVALAKEKGVIVDFVPKEKIDAMAPGVKHQGVAAKVSEYRYAEMDEVFARAEESGEDPFIIILDEISDPHNLGAIIRTAECAGAHGVIIPKRRAASLTQTVALSAAGAIENMPVVQVTNLARTIEELQGKGVWVGAADMDGETYYKANLTGPIAIVIGNEGKGVGRLVKEKCDFVLSIPMYGRINSLNASNAAAVLMYGIRRARTK
ncbi:MAG: 23S rRNA (guanosine(2251)-2'-O)-methyltransferase RlmB [Clostridiales bacterium]|nr:23S rRNA (guanosine(2251)-2'-O)-methyltransferase RlmB [Clostridiales bacterium]